MKVFRGLFWRIFLALWLANTAIIVTTVVVVSLNNEAQRSRENSLLVGKAHAEKLIALYEYRNFEAFKRPK